MSTIHDKQAVIKVVEEFSSELNPNCRRYSLPESCEKINQSLFDSNKEIFTSNRQLENLLIDKFQDEIGFTYPRKRIDSQMFFSLNLRSLERAKQNTLNCCRRSYLIFILDWKVLRW